MSPTRGIALSLLGAAAFAAIALPTRRVEERTSGRDAINQSIQSFNTRMRAQVELWRRADSRAIAREAARRSGTAAFWMAQPPARGDGFARLMRAAAESELAKNPRRDTSLRIVIGFAVDTTAITGRRDDDLPWSADIFPPNPDAANTCAVVVRVHSPKALLASDTDRLRNLGGGVLGPCAWYAAYGVPGRGVAQWLDSTEHGAFVNDPRSLLGRKRSPVSDWWYTEWFWGMREKESLACIAGRDDVCTRLVLQAHMPYSDWDFYLVTPGYAGRQRWWSTRRLDFGGFTLALLERQVGPDAFRSFWKSDLGFPDAFAVASGEPMNHWVRRELTALYAPYRPGPLPSSQTGLALLIALPGSIALGLWAVRRRESLS